MPPDPPFRCPGTVAHAAAGWWQAWTPPTPIGLADWSRVHARLEDGSRYRPFPFQIGILDAFSDPATTQITVKKSARIGYSKIVQNFIGYSIAHHPRHVVVYQPTVDDAEDYSKSDIAALLGTEAVAGIVDIKTRSAANTLRAKRWPGGSLRIKGANSPKEFRRITCDVVILEEPDGYPPTAGLEGDQVELAFKRALTSDERLLVAGSTPTVDGHSKIDALFALSTQEHRYVPCPHCGAFQILVFGDGTGPGIRFEPKDKPTHAFYVCVNGCEIEEHHKLAMDEAGEWRAHAPQNWPHRGFHVWQGYSQFPNASWLNISREFLRVRKNPAQLQVFVNQTLGETFRTKGEAPAWKTLHDRREDFAAGIVPAGGLVLTASVDVQKDRLEFFVWAWGRDRQSWLIDHHVVDGSPFSQAPWDVLAGLISRDYPHASGVPMRPVKIGVDVGFATTEAAAFCRRFPRSLVLPVRGSTTFNAPAISAPKPIDPDASKKVAVKVYQIGGHVLKQELYGFLGVTDPGPGFVHLPAWADEEFCRQLTAEDWDQRQGQWHRRHANEALDGWCYARAAAIQAGVERMRPGDWDALAAQFATDHESPAPAPAPPTPSPPPETPRRRRVFRSSFMDK